MSSAARLALARACTFMRLSMCIHYMGCSLVHLSDGIWEGNDAVCPCRLFDRSIYIYMVARDYKYMPLASVCVL